jgi:pyruvyl transferase EpsO
MTLGRPPDFPSEATREVSRRFVAETRARILDCLSPVRTPGPYALIDYPDHSNVGDVAIWLGSLEILAELNRRPPGYVSTLRAFDPKRCRHAVGTGTVYFLGGGNLGTLYSKHHALRLKAMAALDGNVIVQLPQSVAWAEGSSPLVAETSTVFKERGVQVFCRERLALQSIRDRLSCDAVLCPDLAFGLGSIPREPAVQALHHLLRRDLEIADEQPGLKSDWRDCSSLMTWRRLGRGVTAASRLFGPDRGLQALQYVARRKLDAGRRFLSAGDYLVTDRLHGHILAVLMGIPHTFRENLTGKNRAFWECWTHDLPFVRFEPSERVT